MKRLLVLGPLAAMACANPHAGNTGAASSSSPTSTADQAFESMVTRFLPEYLRRNPEEATQLGDHTHDGEWSDLSRPGDADTRTFIAKCQDELARIDRSHLNPQNAIDVRMLDNKLSLWLFSLDEVEGPATNPIFYTRLIGDGLDPLVTREFAPHAERMRSLLSRLKGIPGVVAAAKDRLTTPPRVFTETAIEQNRGLVRFVEKGLAADFAQEPALAADLGKAAHEAAASLNTFQTFLEKDLLPLSTGDFRIGSANFTKKLRWVLDDDLDPLALVQAAREELARTQQDMVATATELWPTLFPHQKLPASETSAARHALIRKVLDALAEDRSTNATILEDARGDLAEATEFVRAHDLMSLPSEPCRVIEMPEYKRGVAIAYCDPSGPLEKHPDTAVAIAPTPADWSPERVTSFYREYNRAQLKDLMVHEAMPGHFLQLMASNRFKSLVRSLYWSGPFVEGWAQYTEWLMAKYGYGGPKVRIERQKMILRGAVNAILDHEIHAGTMGEKEALELMIGEGFQEESEAVGKWRRARVSSTQLSTYFYGFSELMKLRAQHEGRPGFTERAYHDKLLSFGSPGLRYIRELMQ